MPGIVNIHTHVCGTLFKALTEDVKGSFYSLAFPMEELLTPESTYVMSLLGCLETVKSGSTFINDIYHFMRSTAKAVDKIGLRAQLAQKIYEIDLGRIQFDEYVRVPGEGRRRLEENILLIEEFHNKGNGRITCRFGPHATDTCSLELVQEIAQLTEKYQVGVHTHVAQKTKEVDFLRRTYNLSPVQFLEASGIAGEKLVAAHCVFTDQNDIEILRRTGTTVAHCANMVMKRGNFPPIKQMYEAGIKIGLGTDWVNMDPWDNMRFVIGGKARYFFSNSSSALSSSFSRLSFFISYCEL
jgi:5-methylthioadenosine/S-adenosylhomocysteine deaminase